eukprot:1999705-Alexandrium_andersonii.AAC.1
MEKYERPTLGGSCLKMNWRLLAALSARMRGGGGNEVRPPVRLVMMPPLELLPDPGDDARGLVDKDVHDHLLPHPGQDAVISLRQFRSRRKRSDT